MGEVYRARDTKLNREVAIKVLPAALSNDAQYMAPLEATLRSGLRPQMGITVRPKE